MSTPSSDRQLQVAELVRSVAGEEMPAGVLDEILSIVGEAEQDVSVAAQKADTDIDIKTRMMNETDWRKKASLAAMLISKSFD